VYCRFKLPWCMATFVPGLDASGLHQSRHAVLAADKTSIDKVSHYARRTICAVAGFVAVLDGLQ
jgi:hypothetical protein